MAAQNVKYVSGLLDSDGNGAILPIRFVRSAKRFTEASDEFYHDTHGNYTSFEHGSYHNGGNSYVILISKNCREAMYIWDADELPEQENASVCRISSDMLAAARRGANSIRI